MAFFKLKKRCQYCGSALTQTGNCPNVDCIAHKDEDKPNQTDNTAAK